MDAVKAGLAAAALLLVAARHPAPAPVAPPVAAPVAPSVKAGVELWRAGDYPGAVAMWQPFANSGDADAMFNIGQAFKLGRGVTADPAAARDWYRRAAIKGHLPAQANLGIALFQAGEKPESVKWLRTAADRGEARAQYVLGIAAFNGDGLPRSQSLGYAYLLRAQASGLPQAVTALGSITPGLSPADRTAGEAVAASLAAGTGVPSAYAALTAPRLIANAPAMKAPQPPAQVTAPIAAPARTAPVSAPALARTPPPEVAAARPIAQPTPAQADTAAKAAAIGPVGVAVRSLPTAPAAIATTDVPASKPVPLPAVPPAVAAADPLAVKPAKPVVKPLARPVETALKPFETIDKRAAKKPDGWRVQLGAFSSPKLADTAWADIKAAAAPAKPIFATDGPVTKLQMGPFATRDAAKAACAKLTEAGRACFVTAG